MTVPAQAADAAAAALPVPDSILADPVVWLT